MNLPCAILGRRLQSSCRKAEGGKEGEEEEERVDEIECKVFIKWPDCNMLLDLQGAAAQGTSSSRKRRRRRWGRKSRKRRMKRSRTRRSRSRRRRLEKHYGYFCV